MSDEPMVRSVIAVADEPREDGSVFTAEALRAMANGDTLVWDEDSRSLQYHGPAKMLPPREGA
jgi:hypothetical protein